MAKKSSLEEARELFEKAKTLRKSDFDALTAIGAGVLALAEQVKRVADAQWKKLGQENKAEKE